MVDAGVHANCVHDGDAGLLRPFVQRAHRRADVRRGHHVFAEFDAQLGHLHVINVGQQADDQIDVRRRHHRAQGRGVLDVERTSFPVRMAGDQCLCFADGAAGHDNAHVRNVE